MTSSAISPTITDAPAAWTAGDWNALRAAGLAYIEQFGHAFWTDYNRHDPGITALELLCYAITDLSQRTAQPIQNLLRTSLGTDEQLADAFLTATRALPTTPVSELDYRKLLMDVKGVRNAWFIPADVTVYESPRIEPQPSKQYSYSRIASARSYTLKGLYKIAVELTPTADSLKAQFLPGPHFQQVLNEQLEVVRQAYLSQRNLCEDLIELGEIGLQAVSVDAQIDLDPNADVVGMHRQVLLTISEYMSPTVRRLSLAEMRTQTNAAGQPLSLDEIFEGPLLQRGFIRDADVQASALRSKLYASDLINLLMQLDGVLAVRELKFRSTTPTGTPIQASWVLALDSNRRPQLYLDEYSSLTPGLSFFKNQLVVSTPQTRTAAQDSFLSMWGRMHATEWLLDDALASPPTDASLAVPAGTSLDLTTYRPLASDFPATYGIGPAGLPPDAPRARRNQARQFKAYLLFFDQLLTNYLAQLRQATQLFSTSTGARKTYFGQLLDAAAEQGPDRLYLAPETDEELLALFGNKDAVNDERRSRFLDHLLARFGESFAEYGLQMYATQTPNATVLLDTKADLAQDEVNFHPARGFNYTQLSWVEGGRVAPVGPGQIIVNQVYPDNVSGIVRRFGRLAGMPATDFQAHWSATPNAFRASPLPTQSQSQAFSWQALSDQMADAIADEGRDVEAEAIYVVEHTLLRSDGASDWLPPRVVDSALVDPYGYQVTAVLPGGAPRFANPNFRPAAERALHGELPAHVMATVCWVSPGDMALFERVYHDWLAVRASTSDSPTLPTNRLVWVLAYLRAKSPYFPAPSTSTHTKFNDSFNEKFQ